MRRFCKNQALEYQASKDFLKVLSEKFGFDILFLLQSNIWDYWDNEDEVRRKYLKEVYREILSMNDDVVDISKTCYLKPEMFFDFFHLTAEGNKKIALKISSVVESYIDSHKRKLEV